MKTFLLLLIFLWFVSIDEKSFVTASREVHINDNITKEAHSNDISLECSFSLGEGDAFLAIVLQAQKETPDYFVEIAGFRNKDKIFGVFGLELFRNETTFIHFDEAKQLFSFTFDNLTCRHERQYKCALYITQTNMIGPATIYSDTMWISVTVFPSKPKMYISTKANDSSSRNMNKRSATPTPTKDYHGMSFLEGDSITFMCAGDVGRPEGRFIWQKFFSSDEEFNYSNISTETIPESCSYDGNSTLTIQVTGDDNQARIRCIVKSKLPNGTRYVESEPLRIHFKVRTPFIVLFPNRTGFQEGDSVQLKCKANGNPNPTYSWTKGNNSEEIIVDQDILVINKANISDSGLYTCDTRNVVDGTVYSESISTYINIANKSTTSRTTIRPSGSDNRKVPLIVVIVATSVVVFLLFLVVICVLYKKRRQSKEPNRDSDLHKDDMYAISQEGEYDQLGDRRHKQEKKIEHFDVANICSDSNRSIASKDSNMLDCHARPGGKSNPGGYESVVIDGNNPVLSPGSNGFDRDEVKIDKPHNKKYMSFQKKKEETTNASPFSPHSVEYAQVNEATKLRNINKPNGTDTQTVHTGAGTQERIVFEYGERHRKKDDNSITNKTQQTNGGPETSTRNDQTNTYTNEAFEIDGNQQADENGPQDDGERTRNAD